MSVSNHNFTCMECETCFHQQELQLHFQVQRAICLYFWLHLTRNLLLQFCSPKNHCNSYSVSRYKSGFYLNSNIISPVPFSVGNTYLPFHFLPDLPNKVFHLIFSGFLNFLVLHWSEKRCANGSCVRSYLQRQWYALYFWCNPI